MLLVRIVNAIPNKIIPIRITFLTHFFFCLLPRKEIEQIVGRILRAKTNFEPLVIDICDIFSIYNNQGKKRLKWYYQQILKISFAVNFTQKNNENLIIWDADTIILKKIEFFKNNKSIKYGNSNIVWSSSSSYLNNNDNTKY